MIKIKEDFTDILQQNFLDKVPEQFSTDIQFLIDEADEKGINLEKYITPKYQLTQVSEIFLGLENNVDVSKYNNINLTYKQMQEIRLGLEKGFDLTFFNYIDYTHTELHQILLALMHGVSKNDIKKNMLGIHNMWELQKMRKELENGLSRLSESLIGGVNQYELESVMHEVLTAKGFTPFSEGVYRYTLYADYKDLELSPSDIETLIQDENSFSEGIFNMWEGSINSEIVEAVEDVIKELRKRNHPKNEDLVDYIRDHVGVDPPYEDYYFSTADVVIILNTEQDIASSYSLIPTLQQHNNGMNFKPQSILHAILVSQGVSLNELNTTDYDEEHPTENKFLNSFLSNYYDLDLGFTSSIGISCRMSLGEVLHLKFPLEHSLNNKGDKATRLKMTKGHIFLTDRDFSEHDDGSEIVNTFTIPRTFIRDVLVNNQYDTDTRSEVKII